MDSLRPALIERIRLEKYIREWCGLFVFIEKSTIHLVYQTAKEFLIHNQQIECGAWKHSLMPTDNARILAQICVDALWLFQAKLSDADLLEPADVTEEDIWSLWSFLKYAGASDKGRVNIVKKLLDYECNCSYNVMRTTAARGHEHIVRNLLDAGANVNCRRSYGYSFEAAAECGHEGGVLILLDAGTDFQRHAECCSTALPAAIKYRHRKAKRDLFDVDADVSAKGFSNITFLAAVTDEIIMDLSPHPDRWTDRQRLNNLRLQVMRCHKDEGFWLETSSNLNKVKRAINGLKLHNLARHTDTLASFRFVERFARGYIRLGFLRQLNDKRGKRARSVEGTTADELERRS
ncbi:uncharacterized protein Z519_04199 [Cladophialophora bantiana CBS 173.52]|uniref:Uncharacterized protein n=1 Tax=Cladophialophora bantiana (strain ATCC 10958 / CBS 173.52 / CDC B-1940 / NIH 8579) TaxID=1442370 RepID=A0A0D2IFR9_CLAB1|nr:uncharacterized protein Z519_04199 [Cladophialophora bantiana CBS 173.52]KIW95614.1 hypothetical protein Z519_04199 [Cladophialophora bantiana CBS 173.52]